VSTFHASLRAAGCTGTDKRPMLPDLYTCVMCSGEVTAGMSCFKS
jgi:hypothetical protein